MYVYMYVCMYVCVCVCPRSDILPVKMNREKAVDAGLVSLLVSAEKQVTCAPRGARESIVTPALAGSGVILTGRQGFRGQNKTLLPACSQLLAAGSLNSCDRNPFLRAQDNEMCLSTSASEGQFTLVTLPKIPGPESCPRPVSLLA